MEGRNLIKPFQLLLLISTAQTGICIVVLPSLLSKEAGHDGWITLVMASVIAIALSMLTIALLKRYPDNNIYEINRFIFGKIIGTVMSTLLVLYMFAATVSGSGFFIYIIRGTLLQETPPWILTPMLTIPSFYLVWHGLKNMSRFLYITIFTYLIIVVFFGLLFKEMRLSFLLPVGEAGTDRMLASLPTGFFAFAGFELLAFFYPYVTDKRKAAKYCIWATLASLVFFLISTIISISVLGHNFLNILSTPFFRLSSVYNAPVLERVDLYITSIWLVPMACSLRNYIFAAFDGLLKVFGLKKTKLIFIIYFFIVQVLAGLIRDFNQMLQIFSTIRITGFCVSFFLAACLLLSFIRKKGVVVK